MRETKFRGKRTYDGKMIYGNLVICDKGLKHIVPFENVEEDGHHLMFNSDEPVFFAEETISEFTGIVDKNGVEIYENDEVAYFIGKKMFDRGIVTFGNFNADVYEVRGWFVSKDGEQTSDAGLNDDYSVIK